jgi:hypothetical protein
MKDWSICEWCAESGCADPEWNLSKIENYEYPDSSELPAIQEDQRLILTYQCDCDKPHDQLKPEPCEDCISLAVDIINGSTGNLQLGECSNCIDCGIGIEDFERALNFKYCWACAHIKHICGCGGPINQ